MGGPGSGSAPRDGRRAVASGQARDAALRAEQALVRARALIDARAYEASIAELKAAHDLSRRALRSVFVANGDVKPDL